jgi:hypothetical protein
VPKRPSGTWPRICAAVASSMAASRPSLPYNGVLIGPGLTTFTRTPRGSSSADSVLASDISAATCWRGSHEGQALEWWLAQLRQERLAQRLVQGLDLFS